VRKFARTCGVALALLAVGSLTGHELVHAIEHAHHVDSGDCALCHAAAGQAPLQVSFGRPDVVVVAPPVLATIMSVAILADVSLARGPPTA